MKATRQLLSLCLVIGMIPKGYTFFNPSSKGIPTTFADCQTYNLLSSGSGG